MKSEKTLVEMLRYNSDIPHESVVDHNGTKKVYRYDPETAAFLEIVIDHRTGIPKKPTPLPDGSAVPLSGWVEAPRVEEDTDPMTVPSYLAHLEVPRLSETTLALPVTIPRILDDESEAFQELVSGVCERTGDATVKPNSSQRRSRRKERQIIVKVLPTPKKRQRRIPRVEVEPAPVPKPLKVIRRRGEEEQKVFETTPKLMPDAMMEGIVKGQDEEGGGDLS